MGEGESGINCRKFQHGGLHGHILLYLFQHYWKMARFYVSTRHAKTLDNYSTLFYRKYFEGFN